ncbi:MAG: 50S ribosomal protein L22 [Elusimicrobia bacterium]|nr:50S ribosomal protein L22 [Elusimicrobiota bacterium]
MKSCAIVYNINVSYRKANLVCRLIRGKKVDEALTILQNLQKKTAKFLNKLLASAIANATNNHAMNNNNLYVYSAIVGQGKTYKRMTTRAKGASNVIKKRHCHLKIVLSDDPKEKEKDLLLIKQKKQKIVKDKNKNNITKEGTK